MLSGRSNITLIISSMKQSARPRSLVGIWTERALAWPMGSSSSVLYTGGGTVGWIGLCSIVGSQFLHLGNSLLRSVTISLKQHHEGGFGEPPKERRSAMYATSSSTMMDWTAADAE